MSKRKRIIVLFSLGLFLLLLVIYSYLTYTPPLLAQGRSNPFGRVYDFFAYAWHYSRAVWLKSDLQSERFRREIARAVWHHPGQMEALLRIPPGSWFELAREYIAVGLPQQASQLLKEVPPPQLEDKKKALEIIAYGQLLGDWATVAEVSDRFLTEKPEEAEIRYWYGRALSELGRPGEACRFLKGAFQRQPPLIDALYWLARAEEKLGGVNQVLSHYEEVVMLLPEHRSAWKALVRLYRERGEKAKQASAKLRYDELTPSSPLAGSFEDKFAFLGCTLPRNEIGTGETLSLDIYVEGWRFHSIRVQPEIRWVSDTFPITERRRGKAFIIPTAGAVVKQSLSWSNPFYLYPGSYTLEIAFIEEGSGRRLTSNYQCGEYLPFTSLNLLPGWSPAPRRREVAQHFGPKARALRKQTYLGPGSELGLVLDEKEKLAALGLISFSHRGAFFRQGRLLAQVLLETEEEGELIFPVRVGFQTAECWWESASPEKRKHQKAPIFRSWPVKRPDHEFTAHEYYAIFQFPRPLTPTSLRVKYLEQEGGLNISDLVLIPAATDG